MDLLESRAFAGFSAFPAASREEREAKSAGEMPRGNASTPKREARRTGPPFAFRDWRRTVQTFSLPGSFTARGSLFPVVVPPDAVRPPVLVPDVALIPPP
jgi:hypothetical protein